MKLKKVQEQWLQLRMKFLLVTKMKNCYLTGEFNLLWGESYRWNFSRISKFTACGALPSSRENLLEWERLFWWLGMLNFYCSQQNLYSSVVSFLGQINLGGHSKLGYYEKKLVMVNILKIHPQKFIYVWCFWIHPKDLLLF